MSEFLETTVEKFIFKVAIDRIYSPEGVWVKEAGEYLKIGLSDFVQQRSGDVAFAEVKPAGTELALEDELAVIETIKVDISFVSPLAGEIVEVNPQMEGSPEVINLDPYGEGWLAVLAPKNWAADKERLLGAEDYFSRVQAEAREELNK